MQLSYLTLYLYQVLNVQFFPFLEHFAVGHSLWLPSQVVANNPIKGIQCIQSQISHRDLVVKISVHSIEVYWVLGGFLNTRGKKHSMLLYSEATPKKIWIMHIFVYAGLGNSLYIEANWNLRICAKFSCVIIFSSKIFIELEVILTD